MRMRKELATLATALPPGNVRVFSSLLMPFRCLAGVAPCSRDLILVLCACVLLSLLHACFVYFG
jgi:hypothetical protein